MANIKACHSRQTDEWGTPKDLFSFLDNIYAFNLDVCAKDIKVAKCSRYYSPEIDSLSIAWNWNGPTRCFMNPPFSLLRQFCAKALIEVENGNAIFVVALLPARTDTRAFHESIYGKADIEFLKGRLTFDGAPGPAPFPSMIITWRKKWNSK